MVTPQESSTGILEGSEVPGCRHHWVIEPAQGPVSQGECQNCHEVREFNNYFERVEWGTEKRATRDSDESSAAARDASEDYGSDSDL